MDSFVAFLFFAAMVALASWRFRFALYATIILFPAYLVRTSFFGLPSTLLELAVLAVILVWSLKYFSRDMERVVGLVHREQLLASATVLLLGAAVMAVYTAQTEMVFRSAAEWHTLVFGALGHLRAYFMEPIIFMYILVARQKEFTWQDTLRALALSTVSISTFAIWQYITHYGMLEAGRVNAFYTSPNAVGLYLGPITLLLLAYLVEATPKVWSSRSARGRGEWWMLLVVYILANIAILFTVSQGTYVALAAGMLVFGFVLGYHKTVATLALCGIIIALLIPVLRQPILFQDKAGQNRLTLWGYSWNYLTASPRHFVWGAGLRQFFDKIQRPIFVQHPKDLERHIYPHNILFNFWTETGLGGVIGFALVLVALVIIAIQLLPFEPVMAAGFIAVWSALVVHGLVDVPYFKNDLALLFWTIAALTIVCAESRLPSWRGEA